MREFKITYQNPDQLTPYPRNARTHSRRHIRQIANSIEEFGWTNPILVDPDGMVIAGHGRVLAALELGYTSVPTIALKDLSDLQKRAYILADNKLAENAGWDRDTLAIELQSLLEVDLEFDITLTGFETPEIDLLIGELGDEELDADDTVPDLDTENPPVTKPGDLWIIGNHRLLCGDATKHQDISCLLGGEKAQMVFTDPPYNVPIDGHVCGLGAVKHREFVMAAGEMSAAEFEAFLKGVFDNVARHSSDGALHFICMDWRHMGEVLSAGSNAYTELKNLCVWAKTNGGMGSLYRSQHELVFVFKSGTKPHINNIELGKHGRNRTNVWTYAGINTFGANRDQELAMHPTVKPVALVVDAIFDCSHRGGIVLDVFTGSGTTLVAAERTGRHGYGLEIDPRYCDVVVRRLTAEANVQAVHAASGQPFDLIAHERSVESTVIVTPASSEGTETEEGV